MICELAFGEWKKVFSSCPVELQPNLGDFAIFKLNTGEEIGKVIKLLDSGKTSTTILRLASQEDIEQDRENKEEEVGAYKFCKGKAKALGLPIKVASAHIQFDKSFLHIDFLAEKRVGLKDLMSELAKIYNRRIEFRQIGVRTYAKRFDAFGVCGRPLCCAKFLKEFQPITIGTVKLQNLSCGAGKLTGVCGRLMCCLAYEKKRYEEEKKIEMQREKQDEKQDEKQEQQ